MSPFPKPSQIAPPFPKTRALQLLTFKIASFLIIDVSLPSPASSCGGFIRGSLNIPSQSLYHSRGILYELAYKSDMEWVIFTSTDEQEAQTCAGWFLDHVRNTVGDEDMQICVLEGGTTDWVKGGDNYTRYMDGFDRRVWESVLAENESQEVKIEKAIDEARSGKGSGTTKSNEPPKEKVWSYEAMLDE